MRSAAVLLELRRYRPRRGSRGRRQHQLRGRRHENRRMILIMLYHVAVVGVVLQRHSVIIVVAEVGGFRVPRDGVHRGTSRRHQVSADYGRCGAGRGGHCRVGVAAHERRTSADWFHLVRSSDAAVLWHISKTRTGRERTRK